MEIFNYFHKRFYDIEAATGGALQKKVLLQILQNLLENTCVKEPFLI